MRVGGWGEGGDVPLGESGTSALLELPPGILTTRALIGFARHREKVADPIQILKYLEFGRNLKNIAKGHDSLRNAIDCACATEELTDTVLKQLPTNPGATAAHHAKLKLDAVTMNIERRELKDLYDNHRD
jgi:hypothetical protein